MSKNNPHNIKVGDTLWSVYFLRSTPHFREYEVSKVGSKYATVPGYQVNLLTLQEKSDHCSLQFATSKEHMMESIAHEKAAHELCRHQWLWKTQLLTSAQINRINEVLRGMRPYADLKEL